MTNIKKIIINLIKYIPNQKYILRLMSFEISIIICYIFYNIIKDYNNEDGNKIRIYVDDITRYTLISNLILMRFINKYYKQPWYFQIIIFTLEFIIAFFGYLKISITNNDYNNKKEILAKIPRILVIYSIYFLPSLMINSNIKSKEANMKWKKFGIPIRFIIRVRKLSEKS